MLQVEAMSVYELTVFYYVRPAFNPSAGQLASALDIG
jgi:hypothetical protein